MQNPSSLNQHTSDHGDGVLSFLMSQLVDSGLFTSLSWPNGLSLCSGLVP